MTRGEFVGGCLVVAVLLAAMWLAGALSSRVGPTPDTSTPAVVGSSTPVWTAPRRPARVASRSRTSSPPPSAPYDSGTLNWHALFLCESGDNPRAVSSSGRYRGLAQFDLRTWRSVGGHGDPARASRREQTLRAQLLYADRGRSPWPVCGRRL